MVLTLCIFSDHALYFYQVSQKDLLKISDYKVDMISILKFSKGHNSIKNVDRVMVLDLCSSSNDNLYLYKVSLNYLKGFQSY